LKKRRKGMKMDGYLLGGNSLEFRV
jgi:hypothetical protein